MTGHEGDAPPVLVIGASGFAGGHLALRLRKLGHPVRALVRPGAYVRLLRAAGVALIFHLGAVFSRRRPLRPLLSRGQRRRHRAYP